MQTDKYIGIFLVHEADSVGDTEILVRPARKENLFPSFRNDGAKSLGQIEADVFFTRVPVCYAKIITAVPCVNDKDFFEDRGRLLFQAATLFSVYRIQVSQAKRA